jgi:hypothetical protein
MAKPANAFRKMLKRMGYDPSELSDAELKALEKKAAEAYAEADEPELADLVWKDIIAAACGAWF